MWILDGDDPAASLTFSLPPGTVKTIGRSAGAEFIVDAALVSRLHCRLTATPDALQVEDLGSTNGTFVNGKRVRTSQLRDGDMLAVGRVQLKVSKQRD